MDWDNSPILHEIYYKTLCYVLRTVSYTHLLIYQGVEPLIIKERLGHKDIQMTLNTYGHLYLSLIHIYYYEKIRQGKQEKLFHEVIFQIGNREDMAVGTEAGDLAVNVLDEYCLLYTSRCV